MKFFLVILIFCLLLSLNFQKSGTILGVRASSAIYQGDLILTGNNVTMIEGRFDINGNIIVEDNATLILRNAILNFTQTTHRQFEMIFQNPFYGNPRLVAENSTITACNLVMEIKFYGNSSAEVDRLIFAYNVWIYLYADSNLSVKNSNIDRLVTFESSNIKSINSTYSYVEARYNTKGSFDNCTIDALLIEEDPALTLENCTVWAIYIAPSNVNYFIKNYKPCFIDNWNFLQNCSVAIAPAGMAPNVTLKSTQINGWGFSSLGNSNYTISNSILHSLEAHDSSNVSVYNSTVTWRLWSSESSRLWLLNSTVNMYAIEDNSKLYLSWYLNAKVVDSIGQDVPYANITATYPNLTLAELKTTDANSWARLTMLEKIKNVTGDSPIGTYTIHADYLSYSNSVTVNITGNKVITLTIEGFIIPEFPSILILPLFMIVTLLAVIPHRSKHIGIN